MSDTLNKIVSYKKDFVAKRKARNPLAAHDIKAKAGNDIFTQAIKAKIATNNPAYICEIKKASPSLGDINLDVDVGEQAKKYLDLGATCLSVLTDEKFFKGHDDDVLKAKNACNLPILRKDFIIDPYQIYESKLIGADAILLIMAILDTKQALEFEQIAFELGLSVLIESHNQEELEKALLLKSPLIGINNRNLKTLEISLENTAKLVDSIPNDRIIISESGIGSKEDINYLQSLGAKGFLIGTNLMKGKSFIA